MVIYISGLYSGTNPQPGVGIARSLREAFPDATLIGVEYSKRCSGIHWTDFNDIWLNRPWQELDLDFHARDIIRLLDAGNLFISANDLEVLWLAQILPDGHPNLLTPPADALKAVAKPGVTGHGGLPVKIPVYVSTELPDWELHAFCRAHNWKVWLKGPYYEAIRITTWADLEVTRDRLSKAWHTEKLFLQAHVSGYEESVAIAAYKGKLLHAVLMRKKDITEISKTWAGDINPVPSNILKPLEEIIRRLNWSGGGELEMVRDADEQLWLLEWNPRFPAWIHGASLAGHNLSAHLVAGATGQVTPVANRPRTKEFTRVVLEIPVKSQFPLNPLPEPFAGRVGHSMKHPSGLLAFAGKLHDRAASFPLIADAMSIDAHQKAAIPETYLDDLNHISHGIPETPAFVFMPKTAAALFQKAAEIAESASTDRITVRHGYSIKTNPDRRLIGMALDHGFLAEAISPLEVRRAIDTGYHPNQVILNGPGKWWRKEALPSEPLKAVFSDSIKDLERVLDAVEQGDLSAETIGIRLRPPNIDSRFGIPIHSPDAFEELINATMRIPEHIRFGIHFHMASSNTGVGQWMHLLRAMVQWCQTIEKLSGRVVTLLDIGGGWFPDDWEHRASERFESVVSLVTALLPNVTELISEPGKAIAQPSMALAMQILEVQDPPTDSGGLREVVVDGSIAELPMHFFYPHRMVHIDQKGRWQTLGRGNVQLLGRLCMEHDVVATHVSLPEDVQPGDLILFCDAGAYDKSMSYVFGHG